MSVTSPTAYTTSNQVYNSGGNQGKSHGDKGNIKLPIRLKERLRPNEG